jgi:hypothetical protein
MFSLRVTTLSPLSAETGTKVRSETCSLAAKSGELGADALEHRLVVVDEVHLVDADEQVGHAQQRGQEGVAARLLDDALPGVDEHQREVGGRAGDHVAGVLLVAGGVGDDELAPRRGEVAVGDVDGDALLALGAEPVGEQREVDIAVAAALTDLLDVL